MPITDIRHLIVLSMQLPSRLELFYCGLCECSAVHSSTEYYSQEDDFRPISRASRATQGGVSRVSQGGYGAYNAYITGATTYAALGAPTLYDHPGSIYGSKFLSAYVPCNF